MSQEPGEALWQCEYNKVPALNGLQTNKGDKQYSREQEFRTSRDDMIMIIFLCKIRGNPKQWDREYKKSLISTFNNTLNSYDL